MNRILSKNLGFKPRYEVKPLKDITERKTRRQKRFKSFGRNKRTKKFVKDFRDSSQAA